MVTHKDEDFLPKLNLHLLAGWKQDCRENKTSEAKFLSIKAEANSVFLVVEFYNHGDRDSQLGHRVCRVKDSFNSEHH